MTRETSRHRHRRHPRRRGLAQTERLRAGYRCYSWSYSAGIWDIRRAGHTASQGRPRGHRNNTSVSNVVLPAPQRHELLHQYRVLWGNTKLLKKALGKLKEEHREECFRPPRRVNCGFFGKQKDFVSRLEEVPYL